jgi:DNA-binding LytR/AlgR family response regulator
MTRLIFASKGVTNFIAPDDIVYLKAEGAYCIVRLTDGRELKLARNLQFAMQQLDSFSFFTKVHRSWVVNINMITSIGRMNSSTKPVLCLKGGYCIPIAKTIRHTVEQIINENVAS